MGKQINSEISHKKKIKSKKLRQKENNLPLDDLLIFRSETMKHEAFKSQFEIEKIIGSGGSGITYKAFLKNNKYKQYAIKNIRKDSKVFINLSPSAFEKNVKNEICINHNVGNTYNVRSLAFYSFNQESYAIVQELAEYGNLYNFLKSFMKSHNIQLRHRIKNTVSESLIGYLSFYIIQALKHLNALCVLHQDIKPENLLVYDNLDIKLCDFTVSLKLNDESKIISLNGNGSNGYISYESINRQEIPIKEAHKSDIFSFGVLIYKYIFGCFPYEIEKDDNNEKIISKYKNNQLIFTKDVKISEELRDLLERMLAIDYKKRISMKQLINHKWIMNFMTVREYKGKYDDMRKFLLDLFNDNVLELIDNLNFLK